MSFIRTLYSHEVFHDKPDIYSVIFGPKYDDEALLGIILSCEFDNSDKKRDEVVSMLRFFTNLANVTN